MKKAVVLSLLAAGALALWTAQPALADDFHGVVTQTELTPLDYDKMGEANVGMLRHPITWREVEPTIGNRNWNRFDGIVRDAAEEGVRVLPVLIGPGPSGTSDPPTNRTSRGAFARFAGAVAARYGPGGNFPWGTTPTVPITSIQIYNEQNGPAYWGGRPNPKAYGKLVKAASKAIRRETRGIKIVLGGMFGTPQGAGAMTSWAYLKKLYKVRGFKRAYDVVAIHPYSPSLRGIKKQIGKIRKVLRLKSDRGAKLRITELGWGSDSGGSALNKGRTGQAQLLSKAFGLLERKRRAWKIVGADWFAWKDDPAGGCSFCPSAGLLEVSGLEKPSWYAFQRVAR